MATEFDSGGGSKRRRAGEEGEQAPPDVEAVEEDRISSLPEALRLHILGLLPLKSGIRTGALSTQWRALWTRRWPAPASLDFHLGPRGSPQPLIETLERRGRRRLDRFSLTFQIGDLKAEEFHRCLGYAASCAVEDLDVHISNPNQVSNRSFKFRLPPGNPHLARLSLSGMRLSCSDSLRYDSPSYSALEVIHLQRVTVSDDTVFHLVPACPLLRTLDIRYCKGLRRPNLWNAGANLKNVTFVECECLDCVLINDSYSFRSFRYSGAYIPAYEIPTDCAIDDMYICFGGPAKRSLSMQGILYDEHGRLCKLRGCWLDRLIVSNLTVLTLCSSALRRVSAKARARPIAGNAASCKLHNLREVQLLMFALYNGNMDDIEDFLMICCGPRLERLFVQLPTRTDQYKPEEELSESEEDRSDEEASEEEPSEVEDFTGSHLDPWLESEEENMSKGEESEEDQSEQDKSEEERSEEDHSQEDESEEDHQKVDESEEHGLAKGHSIEYESKKELSDGGQSAEETLKDGCENLMLLKMTNFMGRDNEMRLVSFVLKKSANLKQLILFTPGSDNPEGPQKDHLNTSDFLETKLLPLEKASPDAQIILSEPDAAAVMPLHSEPLSRFNYLSVVYS